jgi:hypothetical protein
LSDSGKDKKGKDGKKGDGKKGTQCASTSRRIVANASFVRGKI